MLFGRRAAELESVPPAHFASAQRGDGPGPAGDADAPAAPRADVHARPGVRPAPRIRSTRAQRSAARERPERALR